MAKGRLMIQISGVFVTAPKVQQEPLSVLHAWTWLDGGPRNKTTVQELSAEQSYFTGFAGSHGSGVGSIASGGAAFAQLLLLVDASRGNKDGVIKALKADGLTFGWRHYFYAPSFRDSPEIVGADLAFLTARMPSWSVAGSWVLRSAKGIGAHAYLDEEAIPPPPVKAALPPRTVLDTRAPLGRATKVTETKKTSLPPEGAGMSLEVGPGEASLGLADRQGATLAEVRVVLSGAPEVRGSAVLPLVLRTARGKVGVAPALIARSDPEQVVLFDGLEPRVWARRRAKEIGSPAAVARRLEAGEIPRLGTEIELGSLGAAPRPRQPRRRAR